MKKQTGIQTKPLDFLLDCNIATTEEKGKRLEGIRNIPSNELVVIGDVLYMIEPPKSQYSSGKDNSFNKPTLYELGKKLN